MSLGNAFGYLTAVRVPARRDVPLLHSIHYFPLMGAAVGSLSILFFLVADRLLPNLLSCLLAVLFPQFLAGSKPWRGLAELVQGHRTPPGHGFRAGFRLNRRGAGVLAADLLIKWAALASLPSDWQVRAVFVFPILGYCARAWAFLLGWPRTPRTPGLLVRRRVRAWFLGAALLLLLFLFPVRAAVPLLFGVPLAVAAAVRRFRRGHRHPTLQEISFLSELAEVLALTGLAAAAFLLLRT